MTFPASGGGGSGSGAFRVWAGGSRSLWSGRLELMPSSSGTWHWGARIQTRAPIGAQGVGVSLQLPAPLLGHQSSSSEKAPAPGLIRVQAAPILDDSDYEHTLVYPVSPEYDDYPLLEVIDAPAGTVSFGALSIAHRGMEDLYLAHRLEVVEPLQVSRSATSVGSPVERLDLYRSGVYRLLLLWDAPLLTNAVQVDIALIPGDLVRIGDLVRQVDGSWSASSRVPALVRVVGVGI